MIAPGIAPELTSHARLDADSDALQTDVMRFMALLAFVLMAIFALVQALPVAPSDLRPMLEQAANLKHDIAELEHHIDNQRQLIRRINERIAQAIEIRRRLRTETEQRTAQLARTLERLQPLQRALASSRRELETIKTRLNRDSASLTTLRRALERERQRLHRVEARLMRVRQQAEAPQAAATAEVAPPARTTRVAPVPKRGFSLKFESDAAFNRLLDNHTLRFYAMVGKRFWRVTLERQRPRYQADSRPQRYYEMAPDTVPGAYVESFRRIVSAPGRDRVRWGVVLPAAMVASISERIQGRRAADIIIHANGQVTLITPGAGAPSDRDG